MQVAHIYVRKTSFLFKWSPFPYLEWHLQEEDTYRLLYSSHLFLPKKCLLKIKKWGEPLLLREKLCIYFLQKDIRSLFGLNLNVCLVSNTSFQGGIFQTHSDINLVQSCFIVHNRCPFFHLNNLEPVSLSLSFFSGFLRHSRMWIEKKEKKKENLHILILNLENNRILLLHYIIYNF